MAGALGQAKGSALGTVARARAALAAEFAERHGARRWHADRRDVLKDAMRRGESGGGPMADFGCHRIEVLLDLMGPVAEAHGFPATSAFREREVEDTCVAHLRFRSGAVAVLAVTHAASEPRDTLEIFGTRGSAHVGVLNQGALRVVTGAGTRQERHPPHSNLHLPLVEDFVAALRESREPAVTGEVGLEVARVVAGIYGL